MTFAQRFGVVGPVLMALGATHVAAQDVTDSEQQVDEIIVTAQKREQRISDVPMSISAYGEEMLQQVGATELTKISSLTPGFVLQLQDKFAPGFAIRGVTSEETSAQSEMRVAVFQDGVAVTKATAAYGELFDVERIEVEKGPQATLHGRSALNGAVSIYQKRPTDVQEYAFKGSYGNYDYLHAEAIANIPLTDTLAIRAGALMRKRDGTLEDVDGDGGYNEINAQALRFAARWKASDAALWSLVTTYDRDDTDGGVNFKSGTFEPLDQQSGEIIGDTRPWTRTRLSNFGELPSMYFEREIVGASLTGEVELNDRLSVTSITGYRWFDSCESSDIDGTPTNILAFNQCLGGKQYSEELRLNLTNLGPFEGFIGVSAFKAENTTDIDLGYDERAMALLLNGTLQSLAPRGLTNSEIIAALGPRAGTLKAFHLDRQLQEADITTYDVFADFSYDVTARVELFAGGRVTWDDKDVSLRGITPYGVSSLTGAGLLLAPTPGGVTHRGTNSSTISTGRAGVRYAWQPNVKLYAVYGTAKLPEVVQLNAAGMATVIPVENLSSIEGGVKVNLLGGRMTADASIYHYDYENFQTSGFVNGRVATINAGKADATGFETQLGYAVTGEVSLFGSYGYNKARLQSGRYDGNYFRNSPDHKLALGADVGITLSAGRINIVPLYSWQSKMYFSDDNDRLDLQQRTPAAYSDRVVDELQDSYGLLSLRIAFTDPSEKWTLALSAENLTDEKFIVDAGNTADNFGIPTFIAGPRRLVFAEAGVKF